MRPSRKAGNRNGELSSRREELRPAGSRADRACFRTRVDWIFFGRPVVQRHVQQKVLRSWPCGRDSFFSTTIAVAPA